MRNFIKILLTVALLSANSFLSSLYSIEYLWEFSALYDGTSFPPNRPTIYNGNIAYASSYGSILYWDGTQTTTIIDYGGSCPSSHNGYVSWYGLPEYTIFIWDGSAISQLTQDNNINGFPSIWQGTVAWDTGYESGAINHDIFYYNGNTIQQITSTVGTEFYDGYPSLWNGKITWARGSPAGSQIMFWDGENTIELTSLLDHDHFPSLYNGKIAFSRGSGQDSLIMFWNGTTVSEITQYTSYMNVESRVALWEDMIVWPGYDGQYTQIFLWDGLQVHQVTDNSAWHYDPDICIQGNQIQIVYVETDYIPGTPLTRVIYATTAIPEPSHISLAAICLLLFISNKKIRKESLINR